MAALVLALLLGLMQARYASAAVKGKSAGAAAFAEIDDDEEEGVAPQSPPPAGTRVKGGNNKGGAASSSSSPPPRGGQKRRGPVSTSALLEDLENFDQYDEDEFEGLEALKAVKTQANAAAGSDAGGESKKGPKTRMMRRTEPSDFIFEGLGILYVLLYIINYVWGSSQNRAVAEEWLEACMDKLQENFALVGIENRGDLEREAADEYSLYCSGRVNCASVTITLKLKPRHDLLMYIWGMVQGRAFEDVVMIKAELGSDANTGGNMDALTLAVFPKKDEKKVREDKENKDLESTVIVRRCKTALHDELLCISDDEEFPRDLLPDVVTNTINQHRQYVKLMHFSGAMPFGAAWSPLRRLGCGLRFHFAAFPFDRSTQGTDKIRAEKLAVGQALLVMALRYIDKVVTYKVSAACRERLKKAQAKRLEIEFAKKQADRDKAMQERRLEKIQKEKAALAKSPEELAKFEAKLQKKQQKSGGGVKIKMK